jgi:hypothetical protein
MRVLFEPERPSAKIVCVGFTKVWVPEKVAEKVWEALEHAEMFLGLGFAARFRKICRNKMLRLLALGKPPKHIYKCF